MSGFRRRGLQTVVDTAATAELDFQFLSLTEAELNAIAGSIRALVVSPDDETLGSLRVRRIDGRDVVFEIVPTEVEIVAMVMRVLKPDPERSTATLLSAMTATATFRSAFGI